MVAYLSYRKVFLYDTIVRPWVSVWQDLFDTKCPLKVEHWAKHWSFDHKLRSYARKIQCNLFCFGLGSFLGRALQNLECPFPKKKHVHSVTTKNHWLNWLALPGFTLSVLVVFSFCIWQIRPIPVMDASPSGVTRCGGRWIHGLRDELVLEPLKLGLESSWVDPGKTGTTGNLQRTKRVIIILEKQINLHPSLLTDKNKRNHLEFLEHTLQGGLLFSVPKCPAEALGQLQYRWPDGCTI